MKILLHSFIYLSRERRIIIFKQTTHRSDCCFRPIIRMYLYLVISWSFFSKNNSLSKWFLLFLTIWIGIHFIINIFTKASAIGCTIISLNDWVSVQHFLRPRHSKNIGVTLDLNHWELKVVARWYLYRQFENTVKLIKKFV